VSRCRNGSKQARKDAIIYYEREAALERVKAAGAIMDRIRDEPNMPEPDLQLSVASATLLAAADALFGNLLGRGEEGEEEGEEDDDDDDDDDDFGGGSHLAPPGRRDSDFGPPPPPPPSGQLLGLRV